MAGRDSDHDSDHDNDHAGDNASETSEALKLATADLETGSRDGSGHGEQPCSTQPASDDGATRQSGVEIVVNAADRGSWTVWATGDRRPAHADLQYIFCILRVHQHGPEVLEPSG